MYKQWLVLAYLENPSDFPLASTCLQLSVPNHATAHTLNVISHLKKTLNILIILISIGVLVFVGITIFGISIMGKKTNAEYFEKRNKIISESKQNRILYSYALDTLNWEKYVLKIKIDLILNKTERDSTITYRFIDPKDTLDNYGSVQFVKQDKSIYIVGDKHKIIEEKKYLNKNLSEFPFDLYELIEPYDDANGPFLFNTDYGILNIEAWSAGRQIFYMPTETTVDIEKELLRQSKSE